MRVSNEYLHSLLPIELFLTCFYLLAFVTRISKIDLQNEDVSAAQCRKDFSIQAARKNETPYLNLPLPWAQPFAVAENNIKNTHSSYSSGSSEMGEPIEFDVFEREGFDQIMETVGQTAQQGEIDKFARTMIDTLEIVGGITPGW